jgi:phosphohistidine phosphatase
MKIYLVQHGEAKPEMEDPERPLTERGKETVRSVAEYVASMGLDLDEIIHSGRLRAKQTAELFAQYLTPVQGIREAKGLGPLDDPNQAMQLIQQVEKTLMVVGHLPHLGRLVSSMILDDIESEIVRFNMGGVVCLSESDNKWLIDWVLTSELVNN